MKIKRFLDVYPNKSTAGVYRAGVYDFFDCVYGKVRKGKQVTEEEREVYEKLADGYFTEERDYFEDMLTFTASMHGKPPIGAKAKIAGVKEFLSYNGVDFTDRQRKQLSTKLPKGNHARTAEKDIDTDMLKKILTHTDLKGRSVVLVLVSSGMRIGEVVQVKLSDVDLSATPGEIVVRGEHAKSGDTRTVFISSEAKDALQEWLKMRDRYLMSAKDRNRGLIEKGNSKEKAIYDDRLFPFSDRNVREMWDNAIKKTGLWNKDNSTGRSQVRVHALRKFFRSQLALSCPLDIVEALMGHSGYLTEAYRRYSRKQMAEYYLKAEHHITVMGTGDIREIQDKLQDTHATVEGYRGIISRQAEEMVELRKDIEDMKADKEVRIHDDARLEKIFDEAKADPEDMKLVLELLKRMRDKGVL